jgi:hypothetical protein
MRVRTLVGSKAGQVIDLSPLSARAMLADGRAVLPDAETVPPVVSARVESREDRGMPRGKRRAVR